jgi:hypothetical protein
MKTIYTDRFGLYPWFLIYLSFMFFRLAYQTLTGVRHSPWGVSDGVEATILVVGGGYWVALATRRFLNIRSARRGGRDPTIIRIKD